MFHNLWGFVRWNNVCRKQARTMRFFLVSVCYIGKRLQPLDSDTKMYVFVMNTIINTV